MESEKEPIVLTESAPLSEWMGRLLEIRWFERGLEIAYQRTSRDWRGVSASEDSYIETLREVLEERMQALLDACPVRLDQPIPEPVVRKWEPSAKQLALRPGDRALFNFCDGKDLRPGVIRVYPCKVRDGYWVINAFADDDAPSRDTWSLDRVHPADDGAGVPATPDEKTTVANSSDVRGIKRGDKVLVTRRDGRAGQALVTACGGPYLHEGTWWLRVQHGDGYILDYLLEDVQVIRKLEKFQGPIDDDGEKTTVENSSDVSVEAAPVDALDAARKALSYGDPVLIRDVNSDASVVEWAGIICTGPFPKTGTSEMWVQVHMTPSDIRDRRLDQVFPLRKVVEDA